MYLEGQGAARRDGVTSGYAMAALLVTLGVMATLMTAALPVWRHQAQREKEAELIFRGEQYARAIGLYQRKMGPGNYPPNIDVLVQQKFLRKKYKDPMVKDGEFQIIPFGGVQQPGGAVGTIGGRVGGPPQAGGRGGPGPIGAQPPSFGTGQVAPGVATGPMMGVVSKSKEASIRIYRGLTFYNQWQFIGVAPQAGGGGGADRPGMPGRLGGPGGRGGPGGPGGPGGRGDDGRGGRGFGGGPRGPDGRGGMPPFPIPGGRGRGR